MVELENSVQEMVTFKSGVKLFQDTSIDFENKVTLKGIVTHCPTSSHEKNLGISIGDEIYFRYDVVADGDFDDNGVRQYKNRIVLEGKTVWAVDTRRVIAVKQEGKPYTINGYVAVKKVYTQIAHTGLIEVPSELAKKEVPGVVEVCFEGTSGYSIGERLLVLKDFLQENNFESVYNDTVFVINDDYIIGRCHDN